MLEVRRLEIEDLLEILPVRREDQRGFFSEVWNDADWRAAGLDYGFIQDNHSFSSQAGVLRGLHFQTPPMAQDKLVRVSRGSIFDVAVDIRRGSATFGKWVGLVVSAEKWNQLLVPKGFAHGYLTLEAETEVQYKVSAPYSAVHERAIRFDDPDLAIDWPIARHAVLLSDKDRDAPGLAGTAFS